MYTLEELRDTSNFVRFTKTEYILKVNERFKSNEALFELLKIKKVCENHRVACVTRVCAKELYSMFIQNPIIFNPQILQITYEQFSGIFSGKVFNGESKANTIELVDVNTTYYLKVSRLQDRLKELQRIQRSNLNNYSYRHDSGYGLEMESIKKEISRITSLNDYYQIIPFKDLKWNLS